jgi:hypothetical protein
MNEAADRHEMRLVYVLGWLVPGEFRHFPLAERQAAIAWAAS